MLILCYFSIIIFIPYLYTLLPEKEVLKMDVPVTHSLVITTKIEQKMDTPLALLNKYLAQRAYYIARYCLRNSIAT